MGLIKLLPISFRDRYRLVWYGFLHRFDRERRRVHRRPLPHNKDGRIYVHLGCGMVDHPLFINVDTMGREHIHYVHGVESLPMFEDGYADLVYCSHCLEHIPFARTKEVLSEWYRILKPGGVLRLGVPDFDVILRLYHENGDKIEAIELYLMGAQTYPANFHYAVFSETSLRNHLLSVGFREIIRWKPGDYPETEVDDCCKMEISTPVGIHGISLNLQAVK